MKKSRINVMLVFLLTSFLGSTGVAMGMGVTPKLPEISIEEQAANLSPVISGVGSVFMRIVNSGL
ncbi:MAG: hypothetical protein EYX74_00295 [Desulfobulbaceae bacterium]|nr:MAG: hypothetical protein EYX74_00295 [Desulfobulbaceae bacterium]